MTTVLELVAVLAMTAVAVAGATWPYRSAARLELEPLADPLEDRRTALLLGLKDLDEARAAGAIEEDDFARLRLETESRMARVLRALDERSTGRAPVHGDGDGGASRASRWGSPSRYVAAALVGALALAVALGPALARSLSNRSAASEAAVGSVASFEQRVRDHPNDVAARLDLGQRYLDTGRFGDAGRQYSAALRLDPRNVEALSNVGLLLHLSGRHRQGLDRVRQALDVDSSYPRALFVEGVILLRGLDRPARAADAFRAYLKAAPYGPDAGTARRLLRQAAKGT